MPYQIGYGFEEGSGDVAIDSSGNGRHGALGNNPARVPGYFGEALEFEGNLNNKNVILPDGYSWRNYNHLTFMIWMRPGADMPYQSRIISFSIGNSSSQIVADVTYDVTGDRDVRARLRLAGDNALHTFGCTYNFPQGVWTHYAFTYSNTTNLVKHYINGAFQNQNTAPVNGPIANYNYGGALARNGRHSDRWWAGDLDEFRSYDEELSEGQISTLMNTPVVGAPSAGPPKGTLALTGAGI